MVTCNELGGGFSFGRYIHTDPKEKQNVTTDGICIYVLVYNTQDKHTHSDDCRKTTRSLGGKIPSWFSRQGGVKKKKKTKKKRHARQASTETHLGGVLRYRGIYTRFGQPLCFCLREQAPQLRHYPISTIVQQYHGNSIMCVFFFSPLFFPINTY